VAFGTCDFLSWARLPLPHIKASPLSGTGMWLSEHVTSLAGLAFLFLTPRSALSKEQVCGFHDFPSWARHPLPHIKASPLSGTGMRLSEHVISLAGLAILFLTPRPALSQEELCGVQNM
jgi:hypothetical protein